VFTVRSIAAATLVAVAGPAAAPVSAADKTVDPHVIAMPWCHDPALVKDCGKDVHQHVAVRTAFATAPECAGLTFPMDGPDVSGRWVLNIESIEFPRGQWTWALRTAVFSEPKVPQVLGTDTPREIVRKVCTIVQGRNGTVR
jgi:hypothetical protein